MKKRGKILSVKGHAELTDWIRRAVNAWGDGYRIRKVNFFF